MKGQEPVLKRDLARGDGLSGDIAAPESLGEPRRETVLLIHGTFANKAVSAPAWWHPGSDFCRKLDLSLSQQGSPARGWAHIGSPTNVFAWTGDNLESERRIAGDGLAKTIKDLEASLGISRYHIVAHSHGGNVVLHALRSLADDPWHAGIALFASASMVEPQLGSHAYLWHGCDLFYYRGAACRTRWHRHICDSVRTFVSR